jgi:hypothetical protein
MASPAGFVTAQLPTERLMESEPAAGEIESSRASAGFADGVSESKPISEIPQQALLSVGKALATGEHVDDTSGAVSLVAEGAASVGTKPTGVAGEDTKDRAERPQSRIGWCGCAACHVQGVRSGNTEGAYVAGVATTVA